MKQSPNFVYQPTPTITCHIVFFYCHCPWEAPPHCFCGIAHVNAYVYFVASLPLPPWTYPLGYKSKSMHFLRSIWKKVHLTEMFTQAPHVVPVTNIRFGHYFRNCIGTKHQKIRQQHTFIFCLSIFAIWWEFFVKTKLYFEVMKAVIPESM